ncbi:MAG TPA: hypothetical protein VFR68_09045 [Candidatus Dormibacteraeota bacterium]|nr:hypothetical protein [Candidatus Dormibacteraeota bacterium]
MGTEARTAEQFITGSTEPQPTESGNSFTLRERSSIANTVLQLLRDNPTGLSRGEILERLSLKGDKTGETAVSNALTALIKRQKIVRRERKYLIE